jgi:hypothetical protein
MMCSATLVVVVVAVVVPVQVQVQMQVLGTVLLGLAAVGQGRADNFTLRLHCGLGGQRAVGSGQWAGLDW